MSNNIGYTADELRQVLKSLLKEDYSTKSVEKYEDEAIELSHSHGDDPHRVVNLSEAVQYFMLNRDLIMSLINAIPEILEKNNKKLMEDLRESLSS